MVAKSTSLIRIPKARWIKVSKLDAAKRQVRQTIKLWFDDGDPVSIHTLLYAAVDIVHHLYGCNTGKRLFFANEALQRANPAVARAIKDWPNFFKHGRLDPEKVLLFNPDANLILFSACIAGLTALGEGGDQLIKAFTVYSLIHYPEMFDRAVSDRHHERALAVLDFEVVAKKEFLTKFRLGQRRLRRWGLPPL